MRRSLILVLLVLFIVTGCAKTGGQTKTEDDDAGKQGAPQSHSITKKDERKLMKETRENLEIIMSVRDDTAPLEKALSGAALAQMNEQIAGEKAANRIKMRRYDNIKLKIANITKGIAGLELTFKDNTSVIAADTRETIKPAGGVRMELLLAAKKVKKRWRIIEIFSKELTPDAEAKKPEV